MKRFAAICTVAALLVLTGGEGRVKACTNVIVSPGASKDGSSLISYAADSHSLYGELYFHPAAKWKAGTMMKVYDWDSGKYLGDIPNVPSTWQTVGNMNEHQLIIGETTYGGRSELHGKGIMDYGSLIYIALQRARTAREAIDVIVSLANEYGYASSGESFSIADTKEAWVMDLIGKGDGSGIVWVARRVPDGFICAHANQARITTFPLDDPENCLYAPDVISFAREKGYFDGEDRDFDFSATYDPYDFETVRACDARAWSAFNILCDGVFTYIDAEGREVSAPASDYLEYAMGDITKARMPLFVKPSRKLTVKDVADVMRDHFEGTPMDMTVDIGAGGNGLPYRWRPMRYEVDGKKYVNERAIATQQTGFWFVGQSRGYLPDEIGGILWFGTDDAATSYVTPIYTSSTAVPECFRCGNGDMLHYSPTASFWMNNRIANACYKMYDKMAPYVRGQIDAFELYQLEKGVKAADEKALSLYKERGKNKKVKKFLTKYSVGTAQDQFNAWVKLEETLLVKFIDGNVKSQDENGNFLHTEYSDGVPDKIQMPGYSERWKRAVVLDNGKTLMVKE